MKLKVRLLSPSAALPRYASPGAACADLYADVPEEGLTVRVGETALVPTGIAAEPETAEESTPQENVVLLIFARSGLAAKQGISLANGVGVVDSDYRGEIKVALHNFGTEDYTVHRGDRIAQLGVFPVFRAEIEEVSSLGDTDRGDGGFGHSGR